MWGVERESIFVVGPGRHQHRYATAVEHAVGYYLAGSKCKLICAKKVYYSNKPKYFFLCVNSRITSNIFSGT